MKDAPLKRFRPERPICLSRVNTGLKTDDQVEELVEKLRDRGWLCVLKSADIKLKSAHLSFNDVEKEFQAFKKDLASLGITLTGPVVSLDEAEELDEAEAAANSPAEPNATHETSDGGAIVID